MNGYAVEAKKLSNIVIAKFAAIEKSNPHFAICEWASGLVVVKSVSDADRRKLGSECRRLKAILVDSCRGGNLFDRETEAAYVVLKNADLCLHDLYMAQV